MRITQDCSYSTFGHLESPATFDLFLGKGRPFALSVETGASEAHIDLGGVPITRVDLKHGADNLEMDFSAPNPQPLDLFRVSSGAGNTEITNLGNANLGEMNVEGGAAGFVLDFGGVLRRDAHVSIQTGMAGVEVSIPRTMAAKIENDSVLGTLNVGEGLTKQKGTYLTQPALTGASPTLFLETSVTLGSLDLKVN